MAECYEKLTFERCNALCAPLSGLKISMTWQSVDPSLFLELGRLHREKLPGRTAVLTGQVTFLTGQVTVMMESSWRVEGPRSIRLGSSFSTRRLKRLLPELVGLKVSELRAEPETKELRVQLSDGTVLRTFTDWTSQPEWTILFKDRRLFPLASIWDRVDVTPCIDMGSGRPKISYCFDPAQANVATLKRLYRFPR